MSTSSLNPQNFTDVKEHPTHNISCFLIRKQTIQACYYLPVLDKTFSDVTDVSWFVYYDSNCHKNSNKTDIEIIYSITTFCIINFNFRNNLPPDDIFKTAFFTFIRRLS